MLGASLLAAASWSAPMPSAEVAGVQHDAPTWPADPRPVDRRAILSRYAQLPLSFEKNAGQADRQVDYMAKGLGYQVSVDSSGATLRTSGGAIRGTSQSEVGEAIRVRWHQAQPNTSASGVEELEGKVNYLIGNDPSKHLANVPTFAKVAYPGLYRGIDLVYYGSQGQLEYDFVVAPGADLSQVRFSIEGASGVSLGKAGDLLIRTKGGRLTMLQPTVYQMIAGNRRAVAGRYVRKGANQFAFAVAAYDASVPLIVDPVLSYATYVGGSADDAFAGLALDTSGNVYLTGTTYSSNYPVKTPYQSALQGSRSGTRADVFVTKLNAAGTALVYSTYLGGSGLDYGKAIAVDSSGSAYVGAYSGSSDFPATTIAGGGSSCASQAVAKLSPAGSSLVYSYCFSGESIRAIAVDSGGYAYVTGAAPSQFQGLTTPGAFLPTFNSPTARGAYLAKLKVDGTAFAYATFLTDGRDGKESAGNAVAVDSAGYAYVGGATTATTSLPVLNAYQAVLRSTDPGPMYYRANDGFVMKVNPQGSALVFSTYLGGNDEDYVYGIAVGSDGSVYVAGQTQSSDFPVKNAMQEQKAGVLVTAGNSLPNGFVAKLNPQGDGLIYSTFLGGEVCTAPCQIGSGAAAAANQGDRANSVWVDGAGRAHVAGLARSYTFPLVDSLLPAKTTETDDALFVSRLSQAGTALLYSTLVRVGPGVGAQDAAAGVAVDQAGSAYVGGAVLPGGTFPVTSGVFQSAEAGGLDSAVAKVASTANSLTLTSSGSPAIANSPITLTATSSAGLNGTVTFLDRTTVLGTATLSGGSASLSVALPSGIHRLSAVYRSASGTADSPMLYLTVDPALMCQ